MPEARAGVKLYRANWTTLKPEHHEFLQPVEEFRVEGELSLPAKPMRVGVSPEPLSAPT